GAGRHRDRGSPLQRAAFRAHRAASLSADGLVGPGLERSALPADRDRPDPADGGRRRQLYRRPAVLSLARPPVQQLHVAPVRGSRRRMVLYRDLPFPADLIKALTRGGYTLKRKCTTSP